MRALYDLGLTGVLVLGRSVGREVRGGRAHYAAVRVSPNLVVGLVLLKKEVRYVRTSS